MTALNSLFKVSNLNYDKRGKIRLNSKFKKQSEGEEAWMRIIVIKKKKKKTDDFSYVKW